ncbi:hypothetical protein Dalk_4479 [Desulfatibacillum aliphaticivorans]|uniref:Uncharacterized protein n=2 Tax=Desulfatibacillum aliphaticivorans TaxID=218208 RepID=B8FCJ5_DESAL|nr:hypothetical protein Dalk_4479 [Desulfatibacillum aliphaticivorans]
MPGICAGSPKRRGFAGRARCVYMIDRNIVLDNEAEQLFRDLGGVDAGNNLSPAKAANGLAEALHDEEKRRDAWRLLMVDYAFEFTMFIQTAQSGSLQKTRESINRIMENLRKLSTMPDHGEWLVLKYWGRVIPGAGSASKRYDFIMRYGALFLDIPQIKDTARRLGVTASHMPSKATTAFEYLGKIGLGGFVIHMGKWTDEDRKNVSRSMELLAGYWYALALQSGEVPKDPGEKENAPKLTPTPIVTDEKGRPDPNLSLLAAYSGVKVKALTQLVQKISVMLARAKQGDPLEQFTGVYETIFAFKKLKAQLKRPPLEINSVRWLITDHPAEPVSRFKAKLTRIIQSEFGLQPQKVARTLHSLYADDYGSVDAYVLGERLALASDVINAVETGMSQKNGLAADLDMEGESLIIDILGSVESRLDLVPDEVYYSINISGDVMVAASLFENDSISATLDHKLLDLLAFFSQRSITKNKIKKMVENPIEFETIDFQTIARDFSITVKDAEDLVTLLRGCFDPMGGFLRREFERNIPAFSRHEKKVFEFLWYYLKEIMDRHDRIAYLNALQLLIDRMKMRKQGLEVLLKDFCHDPENVTFYDRNALMLSTLLLRKYNKELHNDIEITPEEVLRVKEGLDPQAVAFADNFIEQNKDAFFRKVRSIHRSLKDTLDPFGTRDPMPARYILTLEREVYILLSLVGGATARAVLRSAGREYGNPDADVWRLKYSSDQLPGLLQIFQVIIRAIGRVGTTSDLVFLKELRSSETSFYAISKEANFKGLLRRAMGWVEDSMSSVTRNKGPVK